MHSPADVPSHNWPVSCSTSTAEPVVRPSTEDTAERASDSNAGSVVSRQFRHGSTRVQLDYRFDPNDRLLTVTFSPVSEGALSPEAIRRLLHDVQSTVATTPLAPETEAIRVQTSAMSPDLASPLFDLGFRLRSELTLLTKELPRSPLQLLRVRSVRRAQAGRISPANIVIRRGTDADLTIAVDVDRSAFGDLWAMDRHDLGAALTATPSAQLLVAQRDGEMVGFAIVGRSGRRGYLQRLAVLPDAQGLGVGTALVDATCEWSARGDVRRLIVNTQASNANALRLYRRTGFVESPLGLVLLECDLAPGPRP